MIVSGLSIFRLSIMLVLVLLAACSSTPEIKPIVQSQESLISYALSLQGSPYRWGKETPGEGFDCSGFVQHVYAKHGIRLPRTARAMATALPVVSMYDLRAGDLVFFNTLGKTYSHVGIFLHDDIFIHAPNRRLGKVLVSSLSNIYWHKHYVGARRPRRQ
jgi:cell wall-associated NlpC family hydrolase